MFFILLGLSVIQNKLAGLGLGGDKAVDIRRVVLNHCEALTNQFVWHCHDGQLASLACLSQPLIHLLACRIAPYG